MPSTRVARRLLRLAAVWIVLAAMAACAPGSPSPVRPSASSGIPTAPSGSAGASGPATTPGAAEPIRIPLSGAAPDAILLDGTRAWVLTGEGGTLLEVDLAARREVRAIEIGFGPTHLGMPDAGLIAVARFDDSSLGAYLALVDLASGRVTGVETRELGALAAGDDGVAWALEKADRLLKVDTRSGEVVGDVAVDVGEEVHVEVQWAAGSAWVGSDATPTVRIAGDDLAIQATIEVPGGIPFVVRDGLVWGGGPASVWAIDPATNAIAREVPLGDVIEILGMDVDGDEGWLAVRRGGRAGRVLRLDLASGRVLEEHRVELPAAVRLAPDRAWVASYLSNELLGFPR